MTDPAKNVAVYVISDATGDTAERVIRSALAQFEDASVRLVRHRGVRTPEQVRRVVAEAAAEDGVVMHTLVANELRKLMLDEAREHGVDALDMMGPVLDRLAAHLNLSPREKPGLMGQLIGARSRQIEAVDFAFRHDDGQNADDLARAEVVLVGISRTMKTPTTLYLAYHGWFAANVPIVPEVPLPEALAAFSAERVFGLLMSPGRLVELRRVRAAQTKIPEHPYAAPDQIRRELHHAEETCRKRRWRKIDVTGKSVEEVGREIIALLPEREAG
jgi:regulator of PEP synthase PpsR (kinase-PPPase family)